MTTVQTSTDSAKTDRQNANASQNKKSCNATHKPIQIAPHLILPDRTQAHPPPNLQTLDKLTAILIANMVLKLNFTTFIRHNF